MIRSASTALWRSCAYHSTISPFSTFVATKARHVDRILRRSERRRTRELERLEIVHRRTQADAGREHVETLVHPIEAGDLRAHDDARRRSEQDLQVHRCGAGVIPEVTRRMQVHRAVFNAELCELTLGRARAARDNLEGLDDRRALRGKLIGVASADVLRGDPRLAVRRSSRRGEPAAWEHRVRRLDGIAGRQETAYGAYVGI